MPEGQAPGESYEEAFRAVWKLRGLTGWRIDRKWREHQHRTEGRQRGAGQPA